jgi:hypothetical protein
MGLLCSDSSYAYSEILWMLYQSYLSPKSSRLYLDLIELYLKLRALYLDEGYSVQAKAKALLS